MFYRVERIGVISNSPHPVEPVEIVKLFSSPLLHPSQGKLVKSQWNSFVLWVFWLKILNLLEYEMTQILHKLI